MLLIFPRQSLAGCSCRAKLRGPRDRPGWRLGLCLRGHGQAGAASLQWPRDLAGPASEASSLRPETDSPALRGGDGARAARGDPDARRRRRRRGDTGEGWRKQERGLPKRGCGAQKEAADFPSETEEAEEGRARRRRRRRGVPTPGGSRAGTRRRRSGAGAAGGRAAWRTAEVTAAKPGRCPASLGCESCSPVAARSPPLLFPRAGGVERRGDACDFWGG